MSLTYNFLEKRELRKVPMVCIKPGITPDRIPNTCNSATFVCPHRVCYTLYIQPSFCFETPYDS